MDLCRKKKDKITVVGQRLSSGSYLGRFNDLGFHVLPTPASQCQKFAKKFGEKFAKSLASPFVTELDRLHVGI